MKTPRPYQNDAFVAIIESLHRDDSTLLVLPTGTGKTVVLVKITKAWTAVDFYRTAGKHAHSRPQDKVGRELGYYPAIEMNILSAESDTMFSSGRAVVGSVQTMIGVRRLNKYRETPFDLIIIDEAHHAVAGSYQKIVNHFRGLDPKLKVLGVTATPKRADDAAMGIVFNSCAYQMSIQDDLRASHNYRGGAATPTQGIPRRSATPRLFAAI